MTFKQAIQICFVKTGDYSGTASRREFWKFACFVIILVPIPISLLINVFPFSAAAARRLREAGLWPFLPVIPLVVLIVFLTVLAVSAAGFALGSEVLGISMMYCLVFVAPPLMVFGAISSTILLLLCTFPRKQLVLNEVSP